eukprot:CAMPEP_0172547030 /NCGR_PEP_ID=MMETSP1067-20121228/16666_1 /TAXON_ID=265564 ORGANISM="Thalassiosira punctigera, Strain Tpunct2005C2" /NCGR_SAMPLE_ID=MMETSP1067 /ASSEMBLY_ACC=CAM_ASM_000444 /LENGTH=548 /DNA_ID=CAMNT_0013334049 /DNA_START=439 /DNA_END=2085 /DNA_ORIENTATION=-
MARDVDGASGVRDDASPKPRLSTNLLPPNLSSELAHPPNGQQHKGIGNNHSLRPSFLRGSSERPDNFSARQLPSTRSGRPSLLSMSSDRFCLGGGGRGRGDQRRKSYDVMAVMGRHSQQHHQQTSSASDGILGTFRRMSLDHTMLFQEDLDNSTNSRNSCPQQRSAVSDYQEVFQQMKQENPHSSLGALRQKTMYRMAELKAEKMTEEQRQRKEQQGKEEEERLRTQTLAQKCVDKWVGKIKHTQQEISHSHPNPQLGESFGTLTTEMENNHQTLPFDANDNSNGKEAHNIPSGRRASMIALMRRQSTLSYEASMSRRTSIDSGIMTQSSTGGISSIKEEMYINAGLVAGGDDQTANFAPRRSVGDLTAEMDDVGSEGDQSSLDLSSHCASELLSDADDSAITPLSSGSGISGLSGRLKSEREENEGLSRSERRDIMNGRESKEMIDVDELRNLYDTLDTSSRSNDVSDFTADISGDRRSKAGCDELIVEFVDRRKGDDDDDNRDENDGEGLIVGFGDRSRTDRWWEEEGKRKEKEKEEKKFRFSSTW